MEKHSEVFVAFDVAKEKARRGDRGRGAAGRSGVSRRRRDQPIADREDDQETGDPYGQLHVCFEAGPTGYGLYRQVKALGHDCMVVAPALIPKRAGKRIKTNHRDAVTLAPMHRAGELTGSGRPIRLMRRSGTLFAPASPRLTIFGGSASSFFPSGSGTIGSTAATATVRWRIGAGSPARSSIMVHSRSAFRKGSMRSKILCSSCATRPHRAGMVDSPAGEGLPGSARRVVSRRRDLRLSISVEK